jgi:CTP synthase (UTP-ammonia lyase)
MEEAVRIGIIGDFRASSPTHAATNDAIQHAASALGLAAQIAWVPTDELEDAGADRRLAEWDGLWAAPGSPYRSMDGALNGIRFARERGRPFVGT